MKPNTNKAKFNQQKFQFENSDKRAPQNIDSTES